MKSPSKTLLVALFSGAIIAIQLFADDVARGNLAARIPAISTNQITAEKPSSVETPEVRILRNATNAEIFRLYSSIEVPPTNAPELDYKAIKKVGKTGGPDVVSTIAKIILAPPPDEIITKRCKTDPGLGFRFHNAEGAVLTLVCLGCGEIHWIVHDSNGKELNRAWRNLYGDDLKAVADAGLSGLPDDPALKKGDDHELEVLRKAVDKKLQERLSQPQNKRGNQ